MTIDGSRPMGNWGKKIPTFDDRSHITQTNVNAGDGKAVHVTDNIKGSPYKVHTYFDANGNFKFSDFGTQ